VRSFTTNLLDGRTFHYDADDVHLDAIWKKTYVDSLPDSHFMHVEPGQPPNTPGDHRHFPYKDHTGAVDLLHVRHAVGSVHESSLPTNVKAKVQAKLEGLLTSTGNDCVHLDASKMTRTPQGGLRGPAMPTKPGVFLYKHTAGPMAGRIVREYRPPEEVFDAASLATLEQAPITVGHVDMVDTGNFTSLTKGQLTGVGHTDTHVTADAVIQDRITAQRVLSGSLVDLSCGYRYRQDWTPGVADGQAYDMVQRGIRYNHVALLPRGVGRQGTDVALHFDSARIPDTHMLIHLDGKDYDLADEAQRKAYHDAMDAKVATANTARDTAQAHADSAAAELAPLKAAQVAQARTVLETAARKVLGAKAPAAFTGTDRDVRALAVGTDMTGKSDDYVAARFDSLVEAPPATDPALAAALAAMTSEGGTSTEAQPAAWTQRWKEPLTASKDK